MIDAMFESRFTLGILIGVVFGITGRILMLRTDYRQYPTYPHGRIIHLSLGVIAAGLGSVAVPSLFQKDYTAITFLALAAQQFRDVRKMERDTLTKVDEMELVHRGGTYIEGTAMVFEGRNYLVIFTSFTASLATILFHWIAGLIAGVLALLVVLYFKSGKSISHIANVEAAEVRLDGPNLYVGDIYIMNVGLKDTQKIIREHSMGFIVQPTNLNGRVSLANPGQRQAMLYDLCTVLGVVRDEGEPALVPLSKLDMIDGRLGVFLLPQKKDQELAKAVLMNVPLLESAVRMPTEAKAKLKGGVS